MAGLAGYVTPEQLTQASTAATGAEQFAGDVAAQGQSLGVKLKQALLEHFNYNQDLSQQKATAMTGVMNAGTDAATKYADIFDPFARDRLMNQYIGNQTGQLTLANSLLEGRGQNINDIVSSIGGLYGQVAKQAETKASSASNAYDRLFKQYTQGEQERQFAQTQAGKGAGTLSPDMLSLITQALIGGNGNVGGDKVDLYPGMKAGQAVPPGYVRGDGSVAPENQLFVPHDESNRYATGTTTSSTDKISQMLGLMALKTANSPAEFKAALEMLSPSSKPLSATAEKNTNLAEFGLTGITDAINVYKKDPNVAKKQLLPGQFLSRDFDTALFRAVNALLRYQSGAAVPEQEVRRYMSGLAPTFVDNPEFGLKLLSDLKTDLERMKSTKSGGEQYTSPSGGVVLVEP